MTTDPNPSPDSQPPTRATILASALGGVGVLALIALVLFRVLGGVNQAVNNAAEEQREREERLRRQLGQFGGGNQPALDATRARAFQDVEHADPVLRLESVSVISKLYLDDPRAVPALLKRLKEDRDARVRLAAIRALKAIDPRPPAVADALRASFQDDDPRVRAEAEPAPESKGE